MSRKPNHSPPSFSRVHHIPSQALPYQNPYNTTPFVNYQTALTSNGHAAADSQLRTSFRMPDFSSMSNSALVNALLAAPANSPGPGQQEQEQEREHGQFSISSPDTTFLGTDRKRAYPTDDPPNGTYDCEGQETLNQSTRRASSRRPRKQQKKDSVGLIQKNDEYIEGNNGDGSGGPPEPRKPRRSTRAKRSSPSVVSLDAQDIVDASSVVNEEDSKTTNMKTNKARPVRLIRKKPIGTPVPKTLDEAGAADRMMWEWKNKGKNWEEIRAEWKKLTGVEPGGSSLSVRYIKLVENLARNGAAGDLELLRFKKETEEELMSQLWPKVAEKMLAFSADSEHNPRDLQKRYNMIVRSGYDVEKLLEEDRNKKEAEQTTHAPGPESSSSLSESTFPPSKADEYDNAVANATAATLSERNDHDDVGLLQREVDGLNEIPEFPGLTYPGGPLTLVDYYDSD